jgi:16S rRNA (cytosine1407-C5)-methyltransferase
MNHKRRSTIKDQSAPHLPLLQAEKYRSFMAEEEFEQLQNEISKPLPPALRINLLRHDVENFKAQLHRIYGWDFVPIPFCSSGLRVTTPQATLSNTIEHRMGDFYIQEAASMLPAQLFDYAASTRPLILDMAASPGGKTIQLADLSQDKGFIIANDSSRARISALRFVLSKWGVIKQAITNLPGEVFGSILPETFDLVLLDAPCSMDGLRTSESHATRPISEKEQFRLASRQTALLESAVHAARVDGQIVYATCTLAVEENEVVLAKILEKYAGQVKMVDVHNQTGVNAPALLEYQGKSFPSEIKYALRLWPHLYHTAGFFTARLKKTDHIPHLEPRSISRHSTITFQPMDAKEKSEIKTLMKDQLGFEVDIFYDSYDAEITRSRETFWIRPRQTMLDPLRLPSISSGLPMAHWEGDNLIPAHEFCARFGMQFTSEKVMLTAEQVQHWVLGEDIHEATSNQFPRGSIVMVTDPWKRNLGRGKVLAGKLKNLLPRRLFS